MATRDDYVNNDMFNTTASRTPMFRTTICFKCYSSRRRQEKVFAETTLCMEDQGRFPEQ